MSQFAAQFQKIETWNSKNIKAVLVAAESEPALKAALQERYQPLLNFTELTEISALPKIPNKLGTSKIHQKQWEPDATSIGIMNTMFIEEIALKKIKAFPAWICHLRLLRTLRITESKNLVFPEAMSQMTGLIRLICYDCQLKAIPEFLREIPRLDELSLSKNQISVIPDWLTALPITELDLAFNKITQITNAIGGVKKLIRLTLQYNLLYSLPPEIGDLKQLNYLDLSGNKRLSALPDTIAGLTALELLDLSSNNFSTIPAPIKSLKNIRNIDVSFNPIAEIPDWLGDMRELYAIDIANTAVDRLPSSLLKLGKLCALDIKNTPLQLKDNFSHAHDAALVKDYLTRLFSKKEDPIASIYSDLESRDAAKMEAALKALQAEPSYWQRAEKRYLNFIRLRLNDNNATLSQFADAMLTEKEEQILMKAGVKERNFLSFHYCDALESKLLVDFAGTLVKNILDIHEFCKEAAAKESEAALVEFSSNKLLQVKQAITEEAACSTKGWFGGLMAAFAGIDIYKVMYDHTTLGVANHSKVLPEFMFFVGAFSASHSVNFDIFQSEAPDLTAVFWLLPFIPPTIWGDTEPEFPKSPLSFKRIAKVKKGDFSKWGNIEG